MEVEVEIKLKGARYYSYISKKTGEKVCGTKVYYEYLNPIAELQCGVIYGVYNMKDINSVSKINEKLDETVKLIKTLDIITNDIISEEISY